MGRRSSSSRPDVIPSDSPRGRAPGRAVTVLAVGFLLLDAALLCAAGFWDHRPVLLVGAGACVALAGAVLVLRRRYARKLREIAAARERLREELRAVKPPGGKEGRA